MRGELNSNRWDLKPAWKEGMMFHFCCIWKGPIILMEMFRQFISGRAYIIFYQRKWIFFCQNDHNETTPVMSFKRTCVWNGIFDESALIHFASGVFFHIKISYRFEISFWPKLSIWNPYWFEFHFGSIHMITSQELTEHRSETFEPN